MKKLAIETRISPEVRVSARGPEGRVGVSGRVRVLVDLPGDLREIPAGFASGRLPEGAFHVRNDGGDAGFLGAAPPEGDQPHRYFFVVHAVGAPSLGLDASATPAVVSFTLAFHTLGRAIVHGTFQH